MNFILGFFVGIIVFVLAAEIYGIGGEASCEEAFHTKCDVRWVPINESTDRNAE